MWEGELLKPQLLLCLKEEELGRGMGLALKEWENGVDPFFACHELGKVRNSFFGLIQSEISLSMRRPEAHRRTLSFFFFLFRLRRLSFFFNSLKKRGLSLLTLTRSMGFLEGDTSDSTENSSLFLASAETGGVD